MVSNKLISEVLVNWRLQDEKVSDIVFPETGEISDSAKYVGSNMVIKYTANLGSVKKAIEISRALNNVGLTAPEVIPTTDGKEYACCSKNDIDEDYSIEIEYNGTTTGFCSLVHEFIHYITFCTGKLNFSLAEFPSIYFEKAAAYFLRERGYSEEVVVDTILQRNVNNIEILMALSTIFTDVNAYMKKGIVTREDKIALWQDQMMGVYKLRQQCNEKLEALGKKVEPLAPFPSIEEIERDVDLDCDESTKQFIVSDLFLLDGYQYLLGTSLAESIINKHGRTSLPGMIEVVYDLPSHDANSIAEKFGIVKESGKENNMKKEKDIN